MATVGLTESVITLVYAVMVAKSLIAVAAWWVFQKGRWRERASWYCDVLVFD